MSITEADGTGQRARCRLAVQRVGCVLAALTIAVVFAGCSSTATGPKKAADSYGGLPSFLPSTTGQPDGVLTGTLAHPAVTSQGDAVEVNASNFSALVTVTGPQVPGQGLPDETAATTCTFTITLSGATAAVPIDTADFTAIDHLGQVYRVAPVAEAGPLPTTVAPGQSTTLTLRTVMPTGEGLLRWAPDGQHIVASWDFEVETD